MKVTVNSQRLATELRLLSKVVPTKPAIQILSHVLLRGDVGLQLYATDMEVSIQASCGADVAMPGVVALPCAKLLSLVEQFPDDDVILELKSNQVHVSCGTFKSRLQAMTANDFPEPPVAEGPSCTLDASVLRSLIAHVRHAIVATSSKYVLRGALLEMLGDAAAMVATDGKRLAMATAARSGSDVRFVIPLKMLDMLASTQADGDVEITIGQRHLFFTLGDRLLFSRTIDGEFPKYSAFIPKSNDKEIKVGRSVLAAAMRRVNLVADDSQAVFFAIKPGSLTLTASSAEVGSADEEVPIQYEGDPLKVCVNGNFMLEFLNASAMQTITLLLKDPNSPMLLMDGTDSLGVIMLMRA